MIDSVCDWARVFDGFAEQFVAVYTGDEPLQPAIKTMHVRRLGGDVIEHPLADDFSGARNVALDALDSSCDWALFFDPDERVKDVREMLRSLRSMAGVTHRLGYMFTFINEKPDRTYSVSECIRMSKLASAGKMRMNGRVHEGFSEGIHAMQSDGVEPNIAKAPFRVINRGMALGKQEMDHKLDFYKRLLQLEIAENPTNANALVAMAAQLRHEGDLVGALRCLEDAEVVAGDRSLLVRTEIATWHAAQAYAYYLRALNSVSSNHPDAPLFRKVVSVLGKMIPDDYPHKDTPVLCARKE